MRELSVSETLAAVLVRRGYADADRARAFLAAELPEHDPFLLGDMEGACEAIRRAIAEGKRICVHGDYDADGICATALAVLVLRELGAEVSSHLPSRFDEGYGLARDTLTRLAEEGFGLVLTVDCGVTAVEEVAHARALGLEVVITDHHRAGPELPDCPVVGPYRGEYPFTELCGTGVVWKLGQALLGSGLGGARAPPRPRRGRNRCRRRAAAGREPGSRRRRAEAARAHAEARAAGADALGERGPGHGGRRRDRLPARASAERSGPARSPRGRARAPADGGEGAGAASRRTARGSEPRPPGGGAADPPRSGRGDRVVAGGSSPPARIRRCRRGLARGRDRHRGLSPGRALQPPGRPDRRHRGRLEGLGALDPGLRPPRRAAAVRRPPRALGRPRGRSGALDQAGARRGLRRGVLVHRRPRPRRGGLAPAREGGRARPRPRPDARPLRRARKPRPVRSR